MGLTLRRSPGRASCQLAPRCRGFTLFEIWIACVVFFTLVVATSLVLANAHRHEEALWDELLAEEWAVSVLEQALAAEHCAATLPEGLTVSLSQVGPQETIALPEAKVILRVTPVAESSGLMSLRAVVSWNRDGQIRTLERAVKRRATP
jgi:hypothetical protein